jgi:hypothetical protein
MVRNYSGPPRATAKCQEMAACRVQTRALAVLGLVFGRAGHFARLASDHAFDGAVGGITLGRASRMGMSLVVLYVQRLVSVTTRHP